MASNPESPSLLAAASAIAITAICWWFANSLHPVWWLAWLAPIPLLVYAARARARQTALASFIALAIGNASIWHYLLEVIRLPLPVCLAAVFIPALLMLPPILLWRALVRAGRPLAATFALPLGMTGLAWLAAVGSPHGTFGNLAYSQMDASPVIQIAALAGLWGIDFIVWLLPSALAAASAPFADTRRRRAAATVGVMLVTASLAYGGLRLHAETTEDRVRVGLLSIGSSEQAQADLDAAEGKRLLDAYVAEMETLATRGAKIIVAPESALLVRSHAITAMQDLATRRGVRLLIGVEDHSEPTRKHNAALVFEPAGSAPAAYYKRHLIPGFEDRYTPGEADTVLDSDPRIGMAICKDLDFTATGRAHGRLGTRLLLVPAWDFGEDAWLHARMAILRGVENGFAIARSARDGQLTLSDDRGRVLAQASTAGIHTPVSLVADIPLRATRTPYARFGDALGPLCLGLAVVLALLLPIHRALRPR